MDNKNLTYSQKSIDNLKEHLTKVYYDLENDKREVIPVWYYYEKEIKEISDFKIIGFIKQKSSYKNNKNNNQINIIANSNNYILPVFRSKSIFDKIIGYIYIGDNQFIGITKKNYIPFMKLLIIPLLFFLLFAILLHACSNEENDIQRTEKETEISIPSKEIEELETETYVKETEEVKMIQLSGKKEYIITKNNPKIYFNNSNDNNVYLTYEVINEETNETLLSETGFIKPSENKSYAWNAYESLNNGTYSVTYRIRAYDLDTYTEKNSVEVTNITIIKK